MKGDNTREIESDAERSNGTEKNEMKLSDFIKNNIDTITALGIFSALTMFAFSLPVKAFSFFLSAAFLTGTILIWIELWAKFPSDVPHWRLTIFENVVSFAALFFLLYFMLEYVLIVKYALTIFIWFAVMGISSRSIKRNNIFVKLFRKNAKRRVLRYIFGVILLILVFALSALLAEVLSALIRPVLESLRGTANIIEQQLDGLFPADSLTPSDPIDLLMIDR